MSGQRDVARDEAFAAMVESGMTLTDIGALVGLTCERVRQIVAQVGAERGLQSRHGYSLTAIMAAVRTRDVTNMTQAAEAAGCSARMMVRVLKEFGRDASVRRLFRLRVRARQRARLITAARAFAAEHGKGPTSADCSGITRRAPPLPINVALAYQLFGSWHDFMLAAGLRSGRRRNGAVPHGALSRYTRGCRCDACKQASRLNRQRYRAAKAGAA